MLEYTGDEHDYNASNHGHGSACTARANDNNYDAHERQRLLIAKTDVGSSCRTGRLNIRLIVLNSDASRTDRYRRDALRLSPASSALWASSSSA